MTRSSGSAPRRYGLRLALLLLGMLAAGAGFAQNVESGRTYWNGNGCTGCHGDTPRNPTNPGGNTTITLSDAFMANTTTLSDRLDDNPPNVAQMIALAGDATNLAHVFAYFVAVRDSISNLTSAPLFPETAISRSSTRSFQITLLNYRDANLAYTVTLVNDSGIDFALSAPVAGNCAAATNSNPVTCVIPGSVVFSPQATGLRSARLVLTPTFPGTTPANASASTASQRQFTISGTGALALIVPSPGVDRTFTTSVGTPTDSQLIAVTDNVGDPVDVCLLSGTAPFNGVAFYSITAPGSTASGNCRSFAAQGGVTPAFPRMINVTVLFSPGAAVGPQNAVLSIQRLDGVSLATTIQLRGNAGAVISLGASRLFTSDSVEVDGGASVDRTFTIFSRGNQPLTLSPASFAFADGQSVVGVCQATPAVPAANSGEYTIASQTCSAASPLPAYAGVPGPATECTVTVRFNPQATGRRCGVLSITSNAAPQAVVLEGTGFLGPRLVVLQGTTVLATGTLLDFTTQLLQGVTYPPKTLTLRNGATPGQANLEVALPAANAVPGFVLTPSPDCSSLAPYDAGSGSPTCTVDVAFRPTELRAYTGFFDIVSRAAGTVGADSTFRVNVAGTGSNVAPTLRWEDLSGTPITSLDFGRVEAGTTCTTCTARAYLRNLGSGSARLDLVNAIGVDGSSFSAQPDGCAADGFIAEGGPRCAVLVTFNPATAGAKTATLQAASTGNGPPTLTLAGEFVAGSLAPNLSVSQAAAFDETRVGSRSAPVEFLVANSGSFTLQVFDFRVSGPFAVASTTCPARPFALSPGSGCKVALRFDPRDEGSASGTLEVVSDASAGSSTALAAQGEGAADLSSGGCSISRGDATFDPTLWTLVLLAAAVLWRRRRARRARRCD